MRQVRTENSGRARGTPGGLKRVNEFRFLTRRPHLVANAGLGLQTRLGSQISDSESVCGQHSRFGTHLACTLFRDDIRQQVDTSIDVDLFSVTCPRLHKTQERIIDVTLWIRDRFPSGRD